MRRLAIIVLAVAASVSETTTAGTSAAWIKVKDIRGSGARVLTINLPRGPLVFVATNRGSSNFTLQLKGAGDNDLLVNEIGAWNGSTVSPDVHAGRHYLAVGSDGTWTINVLRPSGAQPARSLPGLFVGSGSTVIRVAGRRAGSLVATATSAGDSNFVVHLVGYGSVSGESLLFNEIGPYHGQTLTDDLPRGTFLLWIEATGSWSIRFAT